MGLFGNKKPVICGVCGKVEGSCEGKWFILKDGCVCDKCLSNARYAVKTAKPKSFSNVSLVEISQLAVMSEEEKSQHWNNEVKRTQEAAEQAAETLTSAQPLSVTCPRCGSTQISADKKGFGVGKAVVGAAVAGPIGLVAGNIGAKKVRVTCLKCGHSWMAGKG